MVPEVVKGRTYCKESSFQAASFAPQARLRFVIEFIEAAAELGVGSCHDLAELRWPGIDNLAPGDLRRSCARLCPGCGG